MKIIILLLTFVYFAQADPHKGQPDNPVNPLNGYQIHDPSLPPPKKIVVNKPLQTLPPSDAIILFNGGDLSAWDGQWKINQERALVASPGPLTSKQHFGSCQLHIEFKVPKDAIVKGQKGGNSGIFLMSRYEVQVQESHSNITYADGQAGAIYGQYPPLSNPSLPQGEWQSYDILFTAPIYEGQKLLSPAQMTVLHNGVVIHNAAKLLGPTSHKKVATYPPAHPTTAPLLLQWHQDAIEFKNIWIREIGAYPVKN